MYTSMIFLFALVGSSFAGIVDFKPCEGNVNVPQVVKIEGCESYGCGFTVGQTVNVQVEFVSPMAADSVQAVAKVGRETTTTQACANGLGCPLRAGEYYIHKGTFTLGKATSQLMVYKLKSADQALVCFTYPIIVN